jgi:putative ABC transport system ATP-binding protein
MSASTAGPLGLDGAPQPDSIASARGLVKVYGNGATAVRALDGVDVDLVRGELTAIMGPSGSGKSTLMHCLAGLDRPTEGTVVVDGTDVGRLSERGLTKLRRSRIGFVFQAYNLVPTLTALENITLPLDIARRPVDREHLELVVATLGLKDRLGHKPSEMSGGQQQRVAVGRALATRPQIIFADEPTGNLDSKAGAEVLGFMRNAVDHMGQTIVMVTHDPMSAGYADRIIFLADGRIVDEMTQPTAERVLERMKGFDTVGRVS